MRIPCLILFLVLAAGSSVASQRSLGRFPDHDAFRKDLLKQGRIVKTDRDGDRWVVVINEVPGPIRKDRRIVYEFKTCRPSSKKKNAKPCLEFFLHDEFCVYGGKPLAGK